MEHTLGFYFLFKNFQTPDCFKNVMDTAGSTGVIVNNKRNSRIKRRTTLFSLLKTSKFWLSLGLFLIFSIHLLKLLAKSQPCSYQVCS